MILSYLGLVVLGLFTGWMINYLADVLPYKRRLTSPFCAKCGKDIPWAHYLALKKCPSCGHSTIIKKVIVLSISLAAALGSWFFPSQRLGFWVGLILLAYLGVVALIDIEHKLILHPVSIVGAFLGLGIGIWLHGVWVTVLGGIAGFAFMLGLYYFGMVFARGLAKMKGLSNDEVALGFGDVNLSGILGLILGWPGIIAGLVAAILLGGVVSIGYLLIQVIWRRYTPFTAIPYAPFLILGAVILLFRP